MVFMQEKEFPAKYHFFMPPMGGARCRAGLCGRCGRGDRKEAIKSSEELKCLHQGRWGILRTAGWVDIKE